MKVTRNNTRATGGKGLRLLPPVIFGLHFILHIALGGRGWIQPFEVFNLLLLAANGVLAVWLWRHPEPRLVGSAIMILLASHALVGNRLAPDSLTSGAILMVNILVVYVGFRIFSELSLGHVAAFVASYFLLFYLFILRLSHAEPLFILFLMGLAATARSVRLLTYFWCLSLAFTFCQPYAWETAIFSFLVLNMLFSARGPGASLTARVFLGVGLVLLFIVLLPMLVLVLNQSPQSLGAVLAQPDVRSALQLTAVTATVSTAILALFGIPLAYGISRLNFRGKALLLSLIDVPIVIPMSAAGLALLLVFGRQQFLGGVLFNAFGIRFDGTVAGICLAQVFVALPFLVKSALAAFDAVPPRLEMAARHLGANSLAAFFHLTLPLAGRGIFLGLVLAWARAAGEFGAVYFLTADPVTAPIAVFNRFERAGMAETAPMVSALILFSLAMFYLLQLVARSIPALHSGERDA